MYYLDNTHWEGSDSKGYLTYVLKSSFSLVIVISAVHSGNNDLRPACENNKRLFHEKNKNKLVRMKWVIYWWQHMDGHVRRARIIYDVFLNFSFLILQL